MDQSHTLAESILHRLHHLGVHAEFALLAVIRIKRLSPGANVT